MEKRREKRLPLGFGTSSREIPGGKGYIEGTVLRKQLALCTIDAAEAMQEVG
jgi:hypothetical protein